MPAFARLLFIYLLTSFILNTTATLLAINDIKNIWLFNINTITESVLLLLFFDHVLINKKVRRVLSGLLIILPLYYIVNLFFIQGTAVFNTYSRAFETITFIALSMIYWGQPDENADLTWGDIATNWIIAGLMLYFAGGFFLFLLSNFLLENRQDPAVKKAMDTAWILNGVFIMSMYFFIAIGFIKCKR